MRTLTFLLFLESGWTTTVVGCCAQVLIFGVNIVSTLPYLIVVGIRYRHNEQIDQTALRRDKKVLRPFELTKKKKKNKPLNVNLDPSDKGFRDDNAPIF